jgi:hypothetical protein
MKWLFPLFGIVLLAFGINMKINSATYYLFPSDTDNAPLYELTADADCIILTERPWRLEWYAAELIDTDNFFCMRFSQYLELTDELEKRRESSKPVYLIVEESLFDTSNDVIKGVEIIYQKNEETITEEEFIGYLQDNVTWINEVSELYMRNSFCGDLKLYQIN